MKKTIVVSAVSLRKGGTLTILRNCLEYLSTLAQTGECRIVALVHKKELSLRSRLLQYMAEKGQFWYVWLYYRVVIRFVYGVIYK